MRQEKFAYVKLNTQRLVLLVTLSWLTRSIDFLAFSASTMCRNSVMDGGSPNDYGEQDRMICGPPIEKLERGKCVQINGPYEIRLKKRIS